MIICLNLEWLGTSPSEILNASDAPLSQLVVSVIMRANRLASKAAASKVGGVVSFPICLCWRFLVWSAAAKIKEDYGN